MAIPHASNETSYLLPPNKEDWEGQGIPDFVYGQEELVMEGVQWPRGALSLLNTPPQSHFGFTGKLQREPNWHLELAPHC